MSTRSAEASIKGYSYQFLHTIKDILNNTVDTEKFTIEGIEDLDIEKDYGKDLIQYKYHEEQTFTNSQVAKPIALMFNHFIDNQDKNINYKLFIYLNTKSLPDINKEILISILKLKSSTDYFDKEKNIYDFRTKKHSYVEDENLIEIFMRKFQWKLTEKYHELEEEIIIIFQTNIGITTEESKILYLSNAIKIINDLSIKCIEDERKITKFDFISKLNSYKDITYSSYILRTKGFNRLKTFYKDRKISLNVRKNSSDFIIQINNIQRNELNQLILELSKKFCYKGNKSDFRHLTFIINCTDEQYSDFKKSLYTYFTSSNEDIKINDGYEDYHFNKFVFNEKLFFTKKDSNKYNQVSYNLKLLHQKIYEKNITEIIFSNPSLFIIDNSETSLYGITFKQFYLNNLENQQILQIIGE